MSSPSSRMNGGPVDGLATLSRWNTASTASTEDMVHACDAFCQTFVKSFAPTSRKLARSKVKPC